MTDAFAPSAASTVLGAYNSESTTHENRTSAEYRGTKITETPNTWQNVGPEDLAALLREAADLIEFHPDPRSMADVYAFLCNAQRTLPPVECWVVSKHYADTDPTSPWHGKVTPWCGASSQDQAEELAAAIEDHYAKSGRRHHFRVGRGRIPVSSVVRPDLSTADYIRSLGT